MQRVEQQAFITIPNMRKNKDNLQNVKLKKKSIDLKDKIIEILKEFTNKQIVLQACKNISIPNNFISINYIESRSKQQLPRIYSAVCTLKKQINRIYRHAGDTYHSSYIANHKNMLSQKNMLNHKSQKDLQPRQISQSYFKRQLTPKQILKLALQDELKYRQKLQKRSKKYQQSQILKNKILQKRKQIAKKLNKKACQIYNKQKQKQQQYYDEVECNFNQSDQRNQIHKSKQSLSINNSNNNKSISKNYIYQNLFTTQQNQPLKKSQFQQYVKLKQQKWKIKQKMFTQMRIKRKKSLNQKFIKRQQKTQLIRLRRYHYTQQQQYYRLRKIIQKQKKFKGQPLPNKDKQSDQINEQKSQKPLHRKPQSSKIRSPGKSFNHAYTFYGKNNFFEQNQQNQQKQNIIKQKLTKIVENKQIQLQKKVDKIKQQRQKQQLRRQKYHNNRFKLIQQSNKSINYKKNDSFILQANQLFNFNNQENLQQKNIRQKHENILACKAAEQTILKLRRLPRNIIQEKLNNIKKQEIIPLNQFFKCIGNIIKY